MARRVKKSAKRKRPAPLSTTPAQPDDGLTNGQRKFCLLYLANGFNATAAYRESHPGCSQATAEVNGSKGLRIAKVRTFLNGRLEDAWRGWQMGGEQALGRVALLAAEDADSRVKLAALKVILEQTGKLKSIPDSIDALAAALRADVAAHGNA